MTPRPPRNRAPRAPKTARELALEALYAVDRRHAFSDRLVHKLLAENPVSERDAALVTMLVRGTTRMRGRIDKLLDHYVKVGLDALPPWIQNVLRLGVYQIVYLDKVPPSAAVDESVKLARQHGHPGTVGLVNAVLRRVAAERDRLPRPDLNDPSPTALADFYSHPLWLVERWVRRFGVEETRLLLEANNDPPPVTLRVNERRESAGVIRRRLQADDVDVMPGLFHEGTLRVRGDMVPARDPGFDLGHFIVQDESESLVVDLMAPTAGEFVVDLCAAPGGKTTQLAELVGPEGFVLAVEAQRGRLPRLRENVVRMQFQNIGIVQADGATLRLTRAADRVLVDAPCSGLGVLAKRADARWRKTEASIRQVVELQEQLLAAGAALVKPGGTLVYSVCSFEPEEGSRMVERFLAARPDFERVDAATILDPAVVEEGNLLTLPHRHRMDGAFAARLVRRP